MEFSGKLGENTLFLCEQVDVIALLRQITKKASGRTLDLPLTSGAYQALRMPCIELAHGCYFRAILFAIVRFFGLFLCLSFVLDGFVIESRSFRIL